MGVANRFQSRWTPASPPYSSLQLQRRSVRYQGPYSLKERLRAHMRPESAKKLGESIFDHIDRSVEDAAARLRSEMPKERTGLYMGLFAVLAAIVLAVAGWAAIAASSATSAATDAKNAANRANEVTREAQETIRGLNSYPNTDINAGKLDETPISVHENTGSLGHYEN